MKRIFLGGTCNDSRWREDLIIPHLNIEVDYFNPVVPDWNEEAYQRELFERENCDFCLYIITPKMTGFYSIAEVIDDSNKRPRKTIFCFIQEDDGSEFEKHQLKSLEKIGKMVVSNGGYWFQTPQDVVSFLNEK